MAHTGDGHEPLKGCAPDSVAYTLAWQIYKSHVEASNEA